MAVQRDAHGRYLKGSSGNYKGGKQKADHISNLMMSKAFEIDEDTGKTRIDLVIEKLFDDAILKGSPQAIEIILTRAFGKPVDRVQVSQNTEIDFSKYSLEELETLNDIAKRHSESHTNTADILQ
jgi:hypothetical protein